YSSFETRARLFLFCGISSERALLRMRTTALAARRRTVSVIPISRCQTAHLVPATRLRPGLAIYFAHPESKGGRSAEGRILYRCRAGEGASRVCKTRRASCEACRTRSPLGAPPRRFLATSPLRLRIISGNALNERGFCLSSTDALRSQ